MEGANNKYLLYDRLSVLQYLVSLLGQRWLYVQVPYDKNVK